jgi:hypothetical protein
VIVADGRLYWVGDSQNAAPVGEYDIATGKIRYLPHGNSVFTSADGRHLYIAQTGTRLIELPADGTGAPRQLVLPAGWYMSGLLGNWSVAGGIVVYSSDADPSRHPVTLAAWNPATGTVKIIDRDLDVIDVYMPPGTGYSLLAWTPAGCARACPVGITNTSTLASLTVPSPNQYGFTYGGLFSSGVFSPDGTRLAVFLNTTNPQDPYNEPISELAIVNTRTGALQLVRAARLGTYEDAGWARWLPGSNQLIVGAEAGSYAVDATASSLTSTVRVAPSAVPDSSHCPDFQASGNTTQTSSLSSDSDSSSRSRLSTPQSSIAAISLAVTRSQRREVHSRSATSEPGRVPRPSSLRSRLTAS